MNAWLKNALGYIQLLTIVVGCTIFIVMTKATGDATAAAFEKKADSDQIIIEAIRQEQALIKQRLTLIEYQISELKNNK